MDLSLNPKCQSICQPQACFRNLYHVSVISNEKNQGISYSHQVVLAVQNLSNYYSRTFFSLTLKFSYGEPIYNTFIIVICTQIFSMPLLIQFQHHQYNNMSQQSQPSIQQKYLQIMSRRIYLLQINGISNYILFNKGDKNNMGTSTCKNPQPQTANQSKISVINCRNPICQQVVLDDQFKQPLQFSDMGSNHSPGNTKHKLQQNTKSSNENVLSFTLPQSSSGNMIQNTGSRFQKMTSTTLRARQCVFVSKFQNSRVKDIQGHDNYEPIPVSFAVIKLMIPQQIKHQLLRVDKNFMLFHSDPSNSSYRGWRLEASGFYSNICTTDENTLMISQQQFFIGKTQPNTFIPDQNGILITRDGYYRGQFRSGNAHGKGTFVWNLIHKQFVGCWENGLATHGQIKARNYLYKGEFKSNVPQGMGKLVIKKQSGEINYTGSFINGRFEGSGRYECPAYVYSGQFREGKKNGKGSFIEKRVQLKRKVKYTPPVELQGKWLNDTFLGPQ